MTLHESSAILANTKYSFLYCDFEVDKETSTFLKTVHVLFLQVNYKIVINKINPAISLPLELRPFNRATTGKMKTRLITYAVGGTKQGDGVYLETTGPVEFVVVVLGVLHRGIRASLVPST